ncbi:MAG TPA: xanthine dehydrogenase family protein subunit M [Actinomycetes bacterium]|nr:xanthine dehydrogenase family protein subunit M [Actinomycetes bacterium]
MTASLAFYQPRSVEEAVSVLDRLGDGAKLVAGGTALTIMLRQQLIAPDALVSIGGVPGLDSIERSDGELLLGALATHRQVETSPVVRQHLPTLAETFGKVANIRVRNAATVGGVMAESDYASDPPTVFLALDAGVEATGPCGTRTIPCGEFFVAFYETALRPDEVLTGVRVPLPPADAGTAYCKYVTRSSEDRPCVGVAALVRLEEGGDRCAELRVAVGAAAEIPQRLPEVEATAVGRPLDAGLLRSLADGYAGAIDTLDDLRGSAWYRTEMVRVWVRRAIERAAGIEREARA